MIFFGLIYLFKENQIFISINVYSYESAWVLEAEVFHYLCATMSFFHRYFGWFWSIESEEIRLLLLLTGHLLISCFVTLLHFLANLLYAWYPIKFAFNVIEPQKNEELKRKALIGAFHQCIACALFIWELRCWSKAGMGFHFAFCASTWSFLKGSSIVLSDFKYHNDV